MSMPGSAGVAWTGTAALKRVHSLNERCLELLAQMARSPRRQVSLSIILRYRSLWRDLSGPARALASGTPFSLLDVNFNDIEWWRWVRDARSPRGAKAGLDSAFEGKVAAELIREALMLAWSTAALDHRTASVLLGMKPEVSAIIADLSPQDVERISSQHSLSIRPRWEDYPSFWGKLLVAAQTDDREALRAIHIHGIQMLGGAMLQGQWNEAR